MNLHNQNIGVSRHAPIYFSHVTDRPTPSQHAFHLHDHIELFFYVSGDVDFILNDTYLHLHPGDIIVAPENLLHKPIIKSDAVYERYYIGLPRDAFAGMDRLSDPLAALCERAAAGKTLIRPLPQRAELILRYLRTLEGLMTDTEEDVPLSEQELTGLRGIRIYAELLRLLYHLARTESVGEAAAGRLWEAGEAPLPSLIARALPYLDAHITEINSVEELAALLGVTPSYLSDLFSRSMTVPLKQYITAKKIAFAKARLRAGDSVTDTAFAAGFCTVSHFIVVFKRVTGCTPSSYRKRMNAAEASGESD